VAAQSSRDRKKARLDDLEAEVNALKEKVCGMYVCYCNFTRADIASIQNCIKVCLTCFVTHDVYMYVDTIHCFLYNAVAVTYTFMHCRLAVIFRNCSTPDDSEGSKQCTKGQTVLWWQKN